MVLEIIDNKMDIAILKKELLGMPAGTILGFDDLDNAYYKLDVINDVSEGSESESTTYVAFGAEMVRNNSEYFELTTAIEDKENESTVATTMRTEEEIRSKLIEIEYAISKLVEMQVQYEDSDSMKAATVSVIDSLRKRYWVLAWVLGETNNIE